VCLEEEKKAKSLPFTIILFFGYLTFTLTPNVDFFFSITASDLNPSHRDYERESAPGCVGIIIGGSSRGCDEDFTSRISSSDL